MNKSSNHCYYQMSSFIKITSMYRTYLFHVKSWGHRIFQQNKTWWYNFWKTLVMKNSSALNTSKMYTSNKIHPCVFAIATEITHITINCVSACSCLSVCLPACLPAYLSTCLSVCSCLFVYLLVGWWVGGCVYPLLPCMVFR